MTPQLDSEGRLRHLLTLEGLPRSTLLQLLDRAGQIRDAAVGRVGKRAVLAGTAVCTLFFEPSTRTRSSFQLAAQRLGADVLNFDASTSSTRKGETARDTLRNLEAMGVRGFVVRHPDDGAVQALADAAGEGTAVVNAGDGRNAHPTQGLLDNREHEVARYLLGPRRPASRRLQRIERAVELDAGEAARGVFQFPPLRQSGRVEHATPGLVAPAGNADADGHGPIIARAVGTAG